MTRDELIGEVHQARTDWDHAVQGIPGDEFKNAQVSRDWNLKDVTGHLASYLRLNVRHVDAFLERGKIVSMRAKNWYQFNKREAARRKPESSALLMHELDSAYNDLLLLLPKLSDEDLHASFLSPWFPASGRHVRLGTILRADVSRHLREHARDVRKWRSSQDRRS